MDLSLVRYDKPELFAASRRKVSVGYQPQTANSILESIVVFDINIR